jgi:hypothetical protein
MLSQIENITSLDLLRDIVQQEMGLEDDQIYIYAQPNILPTDSRLYVVIEYKYSKVYSNRNLTPVNDGNITEEQNVNTQEFLTIQLFSRSFEALRRKEEAVMALRSVYAQQSQEKYSYKLSFTPQIFDLTSLETSAMLYRYDVPVVFLSAYQKIKTIDYFDSYITRVIANDGQPDMTAEFNPADNPSLVPPVPPKPVMNGDLLLEDGYYLLLENGLTKIELEN